MFGTGGALDTTASLQGGSRISSAASAGRQAAWALTGYRTPRSQRSSTTVSAVPVPRSDLLRRVLGSLRDHPHDNTAEQIASLLSLAPDTIEVALAALEQDGFARSTQAHWVLTRNGWAAARADDPYGDLD